ncbi:type II secretion system F family protein [Modestobacter versicolor]|uniref:Tight adherence protein B n=1 Tax=Modestobacter versicolor TaxID=429133 RepID=A0A323VCF7_9ACTN|nr:type II secretion system F family protein [Modestobacter versicolor]MBB3676185.1 tight adherence protein B [Modestobacter versicolor]PZA21870.1 type II secretion system protein F [Modestobacter versicolor]
MTALVWAGVGACALAVALAAAVVLVPRAPHVDISRLDPAARPAPRGLSGVAVDAGRLGDQVLRRLGRRQALLGVLERAGVHRSPAQVLGAVVGGAVLGNLLGGVVGGPLGAVVLTPLAPLAVVLTLRVRTTRRRAAFGDQLDDTLRLMSSSMRAGHSVLRALEAVSHEADAPTAEEFSRVLNEVRVGRDLVVALDEVAERMGSEDFSWVAQAVSIHREVGGNLAEVLDRVGITIRDRSQLRRQARALSAEGRVSGVVLLAMPFVLGAGLQLTSPEYMGRLTGSSTGVLMLATAGVLMVVGAVWVRRVVTVRF